MNLEGIRAHCLQKPGVEESFPFDNQTLVFKVGGKIFALIDIESSDRLNVKCDPEQAIELRERYDAVIPGYHMNKKHWNTLILNLDFSDKKILHCVDESYSLVFKSLPKKVKDEITLR